MAQCECGFTHAHIEHACWAKPIVQGTRCEPAPRCKCGALHAHIQHDCSTFPALKPVSVVVMNGRVECPVCGERGSDMTRPCSRECFVKAGYKAEGYEEFVKRIDDERAVRDKLEGKT